MSRAHTPLYGVIARLLMGLMVAVLAACAGPDRPKPTVLEPNKALIGVQRAWSSSLGPVDFPLEVRVLGEQIYVAGADGVVAALNARTGADLWRTRLATPLSAGVGSDGRYAAVVTRENDLIVLDAGKSSWRRKLPAMTLTAPLIAGGRVFTLSSDKTVSAFDLANGAPLWQQRRSSDALVLGQAGLLTAVGNTLVAGLGGRLVGMDPSNGKSLWETVVANSRGTNEVERLADVVEGFSRLGDQLCVRAFQYAVACVDGKTGRIVWSKPANGNSGLTGDEAVIFGTESDGKLLAWKRQNGEPLWTSERLRFWGLSAPVLSGSTLVVGDSTGVVHFLSKQDGSPLNRISTDDSAIVTRPVLSGSNVIVVTRKGLVQALRPE